MKPIHIEADLGDIAKLVLMPGDPLRAKFIAEKYLENPKLINTVRNMLGYTGKYKGVDITVIGSGMGIPSMGIYSYELAHFYGVKKIIRIGTAGSLNEGVHVRDIVVATTTHSLSTYALAFSNDNSHEKHASEKLVQDIKSTAKEDVHIHYGDIVTCDAFNVYSNNGDNELKMLGVTNPLACEMEAFGLYHIGEIEHIDTVAMMTITDSPYEPNADLTSEERENSLDEMITLALEAIIK